MSSCFSFTVFLFTILFNGLVAFGALDASQSLYRVDNREADFHENYTLLNAIGTGTYSTIFLSENSEGEVVVIKKYAITDKALLDLFEQNGIDVDAYIKRLAEKELYIGQLTDHPNIVKIREVFFGEGAAYVVMDYVEGQTFDSFGDNSTEARVILAQQFLSAIEHFLLRNIMIDDLWSENILISSDGTHLTLIDLGGLEIIDNDADMPLEHYLVMIEEMLVSLWDGSAMALENCKHLLPLREEPLSLTHVSALVTWIEALQQELKSYSAARTQR